MSKLLLILMSVLSFSWAANAQTRLGVNLYHNGSNYRVLSTDLFVQGEKEPREHQFLLSMANFSSPSDPRIEGTGSMETGSRFSVYLAIPSVGRILLGEGVVPPAPGPNELRVKLVGIKTSSNIRLSNYSVENEGPTYFRFRDYDPSTGHSFWYRKKYEDRTLTIREIDSGRLDIELSDRSTFVQPKRDPLPDWSEKTSEASRKCQISVSSR